MLSGGWKQRLALGCAVLHEPPILFLDEPTSGVDPNSRRQFWDLIYELSGQGVTVFVTTHYMEESEYCDRLGVIYRGELIALGTPRELKTEHMQEAVLEIECERPSDAMELLERLPEVKEAALFGKGLHAVARDADAAPAIQADPRRPGQRRFPRHEGRGHHSDAGGRVRLAHRGARPRRGAASGGPPMNLRRLWAVARKEALHVRRDPRSLALALGIPMLMLVMFGYALTLDVDHVPFVVWDQSGTAQSRELLAHFTALAVFRFPRHGGNYRALERAIDSRDASLGLVIPPEFARLLDAGRAAPVQAIVDGSDSNTASIVLGYAQGIITAVQPGAHARPGPARPPARSPPRPRPSPAHLVQPRPREPQLHRAGDHGRHHGPDRGAPDFADHRPRMGARHDGTAHLHSDEAGRADPRKTAALSRHRHAGHG